MICYTSFIVRVAIKLKLILVMYLACLSVKDTNVYCLKATYIALGKWIQRLIITS